MYVIYCDEKVLHYPKLAEEGYVVLNPKLTVEMNKPGKLEYLLPPSNPIYSNVQKMKSIITVCQGDEEMFRGRCLSDKKDFYKRKKMTCEGDVAFLLDSIQRPYSFQGSLLEAFSRYISIHNEQVEGEKQFVPGMVTIPAFSKNVNLNNEQHSDTITELKTLQKTYGGYLRTRLEDGTRYVDWLEDYAHVSTQTIEFGKNLLDLSEYINAQDVFTVLVPLGAETASGRLTVETVNDGKDYIEDAAAIAIFGRIWRYKKWDGIVLPEELLKVGRIELQTGIEMAVSLDIQAVDLSQAGVEVERIKLGDYVRVVSVPHGLDRYFLCSKIVYDLADPSKTKYTFGITFRTLTEQQSNDVKALQSSFVVVQAMAKAAETSANDAVQKVENVILEVEGKISVVYRYKGSVDNYESLPIEGMEEGDVYNLLDTGANYAWTEDGWDSLAGTIDLSGYVTREEYEALEERVKRIEGSNE